MTMTIITEAPAPTAPRMATPQAAATRISTDPAWSRQRLARALGRGMRYAYRRACPPLPTP
jgi:hypothetical protein